MRKSARKLLTPQIDDHSEAKNLREFCDATGRELSRIIGVVVGELDYALAEVPPNVKERSMGVALLASQRALHLVLNLRYFSTQTTLKREITDLSQLVLDTADLFEEELKIKDIEITATVENSVNLEVDDGAIQQVLFNLILNAVEAIGTKGKISLILNQNNDCVEISCSDTGHGIPASIMANIFETYSHPKKGKHFGIGLSVSKTIVEAHGGHIELDSTEGKQTKATFTLPLPKTPVRTFPQRRKNRRIKTNFSAEFTANGQKHHAKLVVLSQSGCFLRPTGVLSKIPEVNDTVKLKIFYFDEEYLTIDSGRVANVLWSQTHSGFGIEFLEYADKARKILNSILKSHVEI